MNSQDWFSLGWTGWISLQSRGLSRVFSNTTVQKHQFLGAQLFYSPTLTSIKSVMPFSHLILCRPLLLPPIPPSIRVFSNESALHMRWAKYWSFSFSIIPSKEHPGLISFRMDWLDLLAVHRKCSNFVLLHVAVQFSQHHLLKSLSLRIVYSCLFCQK